MILKTTMADKISPERSYLISKTILFPPKTIWLKVNLTTMLIEECRWIYIFSTFPLYYNFTLHFNQLHAMLLKNTKSNRIPSMQRFEKRHVSTMYT